MANKLVRGSFIIFLGNIIFRLGGYVYRFLMASLLGPSMYGVLGLTLPFQGIFQTLSAGGLPPAIAKYVAEYNATNQSDMARQTIYTALKIMIFLGVFFGFIMVFFAAPWLAEVYLQKPIATVPLQIVGLITPFSVIVGAFRGAFQGVYKMEYILYTRAIEQLGMILFATAFVLMGFQAIGALWGTVLGFAASVVIAVYLFKNHMGKLLPPASEGFEFSFKSELKLAAILLKFAVPVIITAVAEMLIYNVCTLVMGRFLTTSDVGIFAAADPIARLPLIISTSIATTILPAASEAFAMHSRTTLSKYVLLSYRFSLLFVVPMCVFIAFFSGTVLEILYFTNPAYSAGAIALSILAIGMTFYSLFSISTSIVQGIGNPRIPMYILVAGTILNLFLNWYFVPIMGIEGGALATTVACFAMMIPIMILVFKLTETKAPMGSILKIFVASFIMAVVTFFIPQNPLGLVLGIIVCPIVYLFFLSLLKFFSKDDIDHFRGYSSKFGPLSSLFNKLLNVIERIEFRNN